VTERHLPIAGTANVRDLGGYDTADGTLRWGVLLRGDALADLEAEGREQLARLGLRTVIDLREPIERELDPDAIDGVGLSLRELPLIGGRVDLHEVQGMRDFYSAVVERCGPGIAAAVALLAEPETLPALIHCSAGKDRTGILSAVVLAALGVADQTIAEDYALTEQLLRGEVLEKVRARALAAGLTEQAIAAASSSPPELMLEVLGEIRERYGGASAYLERFGLPAGALERLRAALVQSSD
jgi:protein-tyrosine phosphatase